MSLYLVTGGCGFIGSHLCDALLADGHAVRVLDDLSSGSLSNLPPGVDFERGSVTDPARVAAMLAGVDGCFHLAAIASVERCQADWAGSHRVNLTGTITVFEAIARSPEPPIPVVYASSAAVYGNCTALPLREDARKRPTSAYGVDKYGCELHASVAADVFGVPSTGLRFFNVYGPRQDPKSPYSGVISIFADRIARSAGIVINGDGAQTRDFIDVSDVVAAMRHAMAGFGRQQHASASVFNVCTGRPVSILDLATIIGALCHVTPSIGHGPIRSGEIVHSVGDPAAAAAALGLTETTALHTGLRRLIDWMAEQMPAGLSPPIILR